MIKFSERLLEEYESLISTFAEGVCSGKTPKFYYDVDELKQLFRTYLWEATEEYDPTRGMAFNNFVWMKFSSRQLNLKKSLAVVRNRGVMSIEEMTGSYKKYSTSNYTEDEENPLEKALNSSFEIGEHDTPSIMSDITRCYESFSENEKLIFIDAYVKNMTFNEMQEANPHLSRYMINEIKKKVGATYRETVLGGDSLEQAI